jgi:2,3-bisphosphoglycerate-dependent phosphoglycerate mutase
MWVYLVRHAQSLPKRAQPFSEWRLSPAGTRQATRLANLLSPLGITRVFSSPFVRSLRTAKPFARKQGLPVVLVDDLRERLLTDEAGPPSDEVWRRSWEDFDFAMPGGESSRAAQTRMCRAVREITQAATGTTAVFTHGNVIALFLNALADTFGRKEAERLRNPDVLRVGWKRGTFTWDPHYRLAGLDSIATDHSQTPVEPLAPVTRTKRRTK